jgi:hypothetical protein
MRQVKMRSAVAAVAAVVVAACSSSSDSNAGSCIAPRLSPSPSVASPGAEIKIVGTAFIADCADVQVRGASPVPKSVPLDKVTLIVKASDNVPHQVATATPDANGNFTVRVTLPPDLPTGPAKLVTDDNNPAVDLMIAGG